MEEVNVSSSKGFEQVYDAMNNTAVTANPTVLIILTVIIIFYYIVFSYLGYSTTNTVAQQSAGMNFVEIIMWGLLIFLVLINGIQYLFQVDVKTAVKNIFSPKPLVDVKIKKPGMQKIDADLAGLGDLEPDEVFNIPGNKYTYKEAEALCKAYDAELASYNQIENAYKSGAEWCNYGWSKNQMIFFPTQKSTWHKLQKIKGHENDCGRIGINGGYIANENARFGVNCYGTKPKITKQEQEIMNKSSPIPISKSKSQMDKLVNYYKKQIENILVSPFNYKRWHKI